MKTKYDLIEHCKKAVANNVQYIYGAKMTVHTYRQILALQNLYGKKYVWDSDLNKANKMCCDCSGLISSCTGIIRSSQAYKNTALEVLPISELKKNWEKYIGYGIWLQGHIGVVSDTYGFYYAMDGSARNAVHLPLKCNDWKFILKLKDIDYTEKAVNKMSYAEAISYLQKKKIITTPTYWNNAVKCVNYLDSFIINIAEYIKNNEKE